MSATLAATIEVDLGVEPIAGVLRSGSEERSFSGWLGLAAVLEQMYEGQQGADPAEQGGTATS